MLRTWTMDRISRRFYKFAAKIGYTNTQKISDPTLTELYATGNHAIGDIYHMEPPDYPGENNRSADALLFRLDWLISPVQKDNGVLVDFIDKIDAHTSVECTRNCFRRGFERRLALLDEDYALGGISEKAYNIQHRALQERLDALNAK